MLMRTFLINSASKTFLSSIVETKFVRTQQLAIREAARNMIIATSLRNICDNNMMKS